MSMLLFLIPLLLVFVALLLPIHAQTDADPLAPIKAQLAQVDRDLAEGVLSETDAAATKLEIQRRLLRADKDTQTSKAGKIFGAMPHMAVLLITAGAALLYAALGSPSTPSGIAARTQRTEALLTNDPSNPVTVGDALRDLKEAVAANPDDPKPLGFLGRTAMEAGDWQLAADAYARLAILVPEQAPDALLRRFLALLSLTNRQVSPAAELALADFERAAPNHPAIDFYKGLAALQKRDNRTAYSIWSALLARAPADAWFRAEVEQILPTITPRSQLAQQTGAEAAGRIRVAPRLSDDQIAAVESMSAEDQQAMIRSMLDRLKGQLETNPDNVSGWLRLAQAHMVLGETDTARKTLEEALTKLDPDQQAPIKAMLDNLPD